MPLRGAGAGPDRAVRGRPAVARRAGGRRAGPGPVHRGLPVHDVPPGGPRDDPGCIWPGSTTPATSATSCGSRRSTSAPVRPDRGGGGAPRPAPVRDAGPHVAPAREELRDVVPRVPARSTRRSRPASPATSSSTTTSSARDAYEREVAAGAPRGRSWRWSWSPIPDDPADVIGDEPIWHHDEVVGWVTSGGYRPSRRAVAGAGLRADRAGDPRRSGRRGLRDRDHRATATGAPPADAAASTRTACGCASDRAGAACDRRWPAVGRIVVDGRPVAVRAGRLASRLALLRAGEQPGRGGTLCLAGDCPNCLGDGRRHRLRPDLPDRLPARAGGRPAPGRGVPATPRRPRSRT